MFRAILIVALLGLSYGSPAPKIESSDWESLLQIGGDVSIKPKNINVVRSTQESVEDHLENFIKSHEISIPIPIFGSTVTFDGRNFETDDEFDLKLKLSSDEESQGRRRKKSKLKKIIAPILVVILLKAITLIPLALGILGIKTWNALQLSFISFVTSIAIAVWKLCAKFSEHPPHPHIIHESLHDVHHPHIDLHDHHHLDHAHVVHDHHDHWDPHHRSDEAQKMAYSGYAPAAQ